MSQQDLLAERYGRTKRSRRREFIFAASVATVALASFLVWSITVTGQSATDPKPTVISYELVGNLQVKIDFKLENPDTRMLACDLRALDTRYGIVGQRQVDVPAGTTQMSVLVNTVSPAVTGIVKSCWVK
ncbi:MAG: hypothetical protein RL488_332 [Actinomycetota bacterium]|jgi:hypothetical protein